jgi:exo-1,4-beta-D-glucosaminidase
MLGPYVWQPPYYWFSDAYGPARGSSAEEGDNETIPPFESLAKFIPADHLWPPDDY